MKGAFTLKDFNNFRNNWLTPEKEKAIYEQSFEQAKHTKTQNMEFFLATFSATHSLLLLAEYHEWLNQED